MFEFMRKGLRMASESCDQAEIYGERGDILSVDLEREEVKKVKHVKSTGIGVRVVLSNKIGFSYTTALENGKIEECVAHAIKQARVSEHDAYFSGLPKPVSERSRYSYKKPAKTIDKRIVDLLRGGSGSEDAISYCNEMLAGMKEYEVRKGIQCRPTEGSFAAALDDTYILNSEGIETSDTGTYVSAGITVVASEDDGEEIPGYESEVRRMLAEIDFGWIGREAVRIAAESVGGRGLKIKRLPLVFSPRAVQSLLAYTLIPQVSAENVQRKQSPYHGKRGEEIASEILTIVDDGTMPSGVNSGRMDGEGVPSQSTTIVEKGVLKNFLYDSYTAGKDHVESTGNAVRSFDNLPVPGATNFILKEGGRSASQEEIIGEIQEGLFINDVIGAHTASRASGDFSVVAQNAFGIKDGSLFPVKHVMIAGNMQEVLKQVEMIGNDTRQIYNVVSPSLRVSEMQVIS
ncbi:MAG: TldD/PmbA family protein [Methanophagales archaeon]|nr:TldD/PmbA family protein [Methanophagales archaeon]